MSNRHRIGAIAKLMMLSILAGAIAIGTAEAGEKTKTREVKGRVFEKNVSRDEGSLEKSKTFQGINDNSGARFKSAEGDGNQGNAAKGWNRTYRDGTSASGEKTKAWNKEAGTYDGDRNRTYRDGTTSSSTFDAQKTGEGTADYSATHTNRQGETQTYTGTITKQPAQPQQPSQ